MTTPTCQFANCGDAATHHAFTQRGEGMIVCNRHLTLIRATLVGPVIVTPLHWPGGAVPKGDEP